jgi:hypothetical protein
MTPMTVLPTRHPHGYVIGRQTNQPFWEFWNPGDNWAGSGHVFETKDQANEQLGKLQ